MSRRGLDGQVVLVTGAARGIGAALGRRLADRGARLALAGLEPEELRRVARACGPDASAWDVDVTDWDQLRGAVAGVVERYGGIDVVVANAGIAAAGFVRSIDPDAFERVIAVDLLGVWRTVRVCLPHLVERRGYCLVMSSMAAAVHLPGMAPYNAAKAGAEAFANTLRAEVRHLGVAVGVAHPSWIATDMVAAAEEHPVFGAVRRRMPGPATRTYPVSAAVDLLEAGIARRARTVHVPRSMLAAKLARAFLPALVERAAGRLMPEADAAALADVERRGGEASAPVGPGGAAAFRR
ncbi:MAG: SDR family NAD(P)-dependent oxidoreductase [Chloroflexi bacterium]|nr:MAG: SDR family NAD(P)-dependent oxidoreductase [Chloroflexota bacterium]